MLIRKHNYCKIKTKNEVEEDKPELHFCSTFGQMCLFKQNNLTLYGLILKYEDFKM